MRQSVDRVASLYQFGGTGQIPLHLNLRHMIVNFKGSRIRAEPDRTPTAAAVRALIF
jgi:hypothetical protein